MKIRNTGIRYLAALMLAACLLASSAGLAFADGAQGSTEEGTPAIMFFIMIGGTTAAVLIPLVVFFVLFMGWVAIDHKSLAKMRSKGGFDKLRRIVVTPQEWWSIGEDGSGLRKELGEAGVKVRIQQVKNSSPTISSLIMREGMDLPSAQTVEVARVRGLRYAWIDGRRVRAKDVLNKVSSLKRNAAG